MSAKSSGKSSTQVNNRPKNSPHSVPRDGANDETIETSCSSIFSFNEDGNTSEFNEENVSNASDLDLYSEDDTSRIHDGSESKSSANKKKAMQTKILEAIREDDVKYLLKMHANDKLKKLNAKLQGMTMLHWAAFHGALDTIFWLLSLPEVKLNVPCHRNRWTALHVAAFTGQDASINALLSGSDYTLCLDHMGKSALHMAAAHGNSHCLNALLQKGLLSELEIEDVNSWTPIFHAVAHNRIGCIQCLIVHGAITDGLDKKGNSLVHLAASEGHNEAMRLLFYSGHPVSAIHFLTEANNEGATPYQLAKQFYKQSTCEALYDIKRGAILRDNFEDIAFPGHMAALRGKQDILSQLLGMAVIKRNERDTYGYTLLHRAAVGGHLDIIKWLISIGADHRLRNHSQETPLDVATHCEQKEVVEYLLELEKKEEWPLQCNPIESADAKDAVKFTLKKTQRSQKRCEKRVNSCLEALKLAIENFRQVGGTVDITDTHLKLVNSLKERERQITEIQQQLSYERLVREALQGQLDIKQREINKLRVELKPIRLEDAASVKFVDKNAPARFRKCAKKAAIRQRSPLRSNNMKRSQGVFMKVKKTPGSKPAENKKVKH